MRLLSLPELVRIKVGKRFSMYGYCLPVLPLPTPNSAAFLGHGWLLGQHANRDSR